jgi:hypothetical protein
MEIERLLFPHHGSAQGGLYDVANGSVASRVITIRMPLGLTVKSGDDHEGRHSAAKLRLGLS